MNQLSEPVAVVHDAGEVPLRLHSRLTGPICELTFLQRSLLMAELAMIAYNDEQEAKRAYELIGLTDVTFCTARWCLDNLSLLLSHSSSNSCGSLSSKAIWNLSLLNSSVHCLESKSSSKVISEELTVVNQSSNSIWNCGETCPVVIFNTNGTVEACNVLQPRFTASLDLGSNLGM